MIRTHLFPFLQLRRLGLSLSIFIVAALSGCGGGSGRQGTDIIVTAVSGPTEALASGSPVEFSMRVVNAGANPATNVDLRNSASGVSIESVACLAEGGASCPPLLAAIMTAPSIPPGGSLTITAKGTVLRGVSGQISNSLTASYADDVDRSNNDATVRGSAFVRVSDLVVTGTGPAGPLAGGGTAEFLMTVRNEGPDPATTVRILNTAGGNMQLTSIECSADGGAACPDPIGVSMQVDSMPSGSSLLFKVKATVNATVNGTVVNTMEVAADDDDDRNDNRVTVSATVITPRSGVSVVGVGPPTVAIGGSETAFTMTVANAGPDAASNVRILNNVGSGLTLKAIGCTAIAGAVCPATVGPVMTLEAMPAASSLVFVVTAKVAQGANGTLINTMQAAADNDGERGDNSATASATAFTPRTGVYVTGVGPTETALGGAETNFSMTVGNVGPDAASDVTIVDNVGNNLILTAISCTAASGAACPQVVGPVMSVPSIPVGGTLTFDVRARVSLGANGTVSNTMQASATNDTDRTDNSATAIAQAFTARSELSVVGSGSSDVPAGTEAVFRMTVTNAGPDLAERVRLINTVGSSLNLTGLECEALAGAVCPSVLGPSMEVLNLPVGGSLTFTVTAKVANATQGTITNTLSARVNSGFPSEAIGVATGSAYTNNLSVTAAGPTGPIVPGTAVTFTTTVTNGGPGPAKSVQLSHTLSTGLLLTGSITCTASGGAVCPTSTGTTATVDLIPALGSLSFQIPATVAPDVDANVGVTIRATTLGDFFTGDNAATATFRARP